MHVVFTSYHNSTYLSISDFSIDWIILNNNRIMENIPSVVLENLFISKESNFDVHGSLTMHKCTIETDSLVLNLKGGTNLPSVDPGKGTHLQSYFDKHTINITQTYVLGTNYSAQRFHGKIHFHCLPKKLKYIVYFYHYTNML